MKAIINGKEVDAKLPKAFKKKWVKALRSGEYEQGRRKLHRIETDTYCCLGVACRMVHPKIRLDKGFISYGFIEKAAKVPKILWGHGSDNSIVSKLAELNDKYFSFKYIASYIERYL